MGFFDSLLGLSTSKAQSQAAGQANQLVNATTGVTNNLLTDAASTARGDVTTGANSALASLLAGYNRATTDTTNYNNAAQGALSGGVNQGVSTVEGSNGQFQPYAAAGQGASAMLGNALGLNGQAGHDAATSAFQASPGYQYQVDQATDAAARKAASLGMAGSGNTLQAVTGVASNLANQEYGSFLDRLSGVANQGLTASNAIAGNDRTAGTMQYGGAGTLASLINGQGTALGALDSSLGTGSAALQSGMGSSLSNIDSSLGANLANNGWNATNAVNGNSLFAAKAQDAASNTNNGIFSSLLSGGLNLLGGTASGGALKSAFNKL